LCSAYITAAQRRIAVWTGTEEPTRRWLRQRVTASRPAERMIGERRPGCRLHSLQPHGAAVNFAMQAAPFVFGLDHTPR
jgi:hypothetical protein